MSAGSLLLSQVYSQRSRTCESTPTFLKHHVQMQPSTCAVVCLISGNEAATFSCPPFSSVWAFGLLGRWETLEASRTAQTMTLTQFPSTSTNRLADTPWSFWTAICGLQRELDLAPRQNVKSVPSEEVFLASVDRELQIPCSFPNLRGPARACKALVPCQEAN